MSGKTKYTPEELTGFKGIICVRLAEAREVESDLSSEINDLHTGQSPDLFEQSSNDLSRTEKTNLLYRQQIFIRDLENALLRIKNGTYSICKTTGKLIPKERLRIVPHATETIEAKNAKPAVGHNIARSVMSLLPA